MRLLSVALAVVLLAGCLTPKDKEPVNPLFGLCPNWTQGPGGQTVGLHLTPTNLSAERELGPAEATWNGHGLDLLRVYITGLNATGRVELRGFSADGKQLTLRDYRGEAGAQIVPVAVLTNADVGHEFDVFLSALTHGSSAAATPAHLTWTLDGQDALVQYDVTFHYKVCGADA